MVSQYKCPLCDSSITRQVYEGAMRIDEAQKERAAAQRAEIERGLAEVRRQRTAIAERAAAAERKRAEAEAEKAERRFETKIEKLEGERRKEIQRRVHAVDAQLRAVRLDASRPLLKTIGELRADLKAQRTAAAKAAGKASANSKRLTRAIALVRRDAEKDRARMQKEVAKRVREAKGGALQGKLHVIQGLKGELEVTKSRHAREVEQMNRVLADAKEKLEARDQRHFGPEGEEELLEELRAAFPKDAIVRRGKGGDVIQTVNDGRQAFGTIVYECKRTASFQKEYTRQLKTAMEAHETKYGLLVSRKLPAKAQGMCTTNGVLVVEPHLAVHVAGILRAATIALGRARISEEGKAAKTQEIYEYLRSDDFANATARIDDKIKELRDSLAKERSSHDGWWRAREQHYATILREATGIDGRVKDILEGRGASGAAKVRALRVSAR